MSEQQQDLPAQETRGGEQPDWAAARPGEPLPEITPLADLAADAAGLRPDYGDPPGAAYAGRHRTLDGD